MPRLRLVVFDCDGVMFDSREANRSYYNHMRHRFGLPDMNGQELAYVHSHNVLDSINHIFRDHRELIPEVNRYREQLDYTPFLSHMRIEPDLKEFLVLLKQDRYTAISTNRTTTMPAVLRLHSLESFFDKVVTARDVRRPKPHPEALHVILNHFNLRAEEAVFIGDSEVDREHAAGAGVRLIAFRNPDLPADYHVDCFMDIPDLPFFQES